MKFFFFFFWSLEGGDGRAWIHQLNWKLHVQRGLCWEGNKSMKPPWSCIFIQQPMIEGQTDRQTDSQNKCVTRSGVGKQPFIMATHSLVIIFIFSLIFSIEISLSLIVLIIITVSSNWLHSNIMTSRLFTINIDC